MGGSALKQVPIGRLSASAYHPLTQRLLALWAERFPSVRAAVIPAYASKADFGDIDVLVAQEPLQEAGGREAVMAWAEGVLFSREFAPNGNVLSLDYRNAAEETVGFQVDIIHVPSAEFDITLSYFSYNDLGNLIGRTAHTMGFSYGHRGLVYPFRDGNHLFDTLVVSQTLDEALPFLGYDPARFHQGFADLSEIFDYVTGSRYFAPEIFLLENRNHASRVRDRKRKTYNAFLTHLAEHPELPRYTHEPDRTQRHAQFRALAFETFPAFAEAFADATHRLHRSRLLRDYLSGTKIAEWTGLQGPALGQFMQQLRASEPDAEAWLAFQAAMGDDGLRDRVTAVQQAFRPRRPKC